MDSQLIIEKDSAGLCQRAATDLLALVKASVDQGRPFHIALAGGTTPKALYALMAGSPFSEEMPWEHIRFFFGDERTVPKDHPDSNFHMAMETLLSKVPVSEGQIHRIHGELDNADEAAALYDEELGQYLPRDDQGVSQFDLVLLGLGPDGHVASLFPGTQILENCHSRAAAVWVEKFNTWRISITFPMINHARNVWMFVSGEAKADIVHQVIKDRAEQARYPVEKIRPEGQQVWYLDAAAASRLKE